VVSGQWSVVSSEWSVASGEWQAVRRQGDKGKGETFNFTELQHVQILCQRW